jgi:D-alanine transaminase
VSSKLIAFVNGRFLPLDQATIHIEDRGFQFADSVYEVIACLGGNFLDLMPHLQRLEHSCHEIGIHLPCSLDELEKLVQQLYAKNALDDAAVYIQVTRGIAPRSHLVNPSITPTLVMTLRELPAPSDEKVACGATAITLRDFRWGRCDIKSTALLASVMGKLEGSARGADETFWMDEGDHLLEGCSTNIFAVINDTLVTQPLGHRILGGIMRDMVLRIAIRENIEVQERPWKLTEDNLSECMMSSTTNALLPVCQIDGNPVGDGKPGPVAGTLRRLILDELDTIRSR